MPLLGIGEGTEISSSCPERSASSGTTPEDVGVRRNARVAPASPSEILRTSASTAETFSAFPALIGRPAAQK